MLDCNFRKVAPNPVINLCKSHVQKGRLKVTFAVTSLDFCIARCASGAWSECRFMPIVFLALCCSWRIPEFIHYPKIFANCFSKSFWACAGRDDFHLLL